MWQNILYELLDFQPGDEIVRINGYDLSQALHEEVLWLLKRRNQTLEFKIRSKFIPCESTVLGFHVVITL